MSARLMEGRTLARRILSAAATEAARIRVATGTSPCLATLLVGDDLASHTYVRMKRRRCEEAGLRSVSVELPQLASTEDVLAAVERFAADPGVHGILLQHPVPPQVDRRAAFEAIPIAKDVDGVTSASLGRMILGLPAFPACTPAGIMRLLAEYGVELRGQDALVVGRSPILGRPMASMLINAHATVTLAHSHTRDLPGLVRRADVLIAAVGQPRFIRGDWIKPGAIVVDAGYNPGPDDHSGNIGDVDFQAAAERAAFITPVPGGVGPLTIATLVEHTVQAAAAQLRVAQ